MQNNLYAHYATSQCGVSGALSRPDSGAYEHTHVCQLESGIQAWRRRAVDAAVRGMSGTNARFEADEAFRPEHDETSTKWAASVPYERLSASSSPPVHPRGRELETATATASSSDQHSHPLDTAHGASREGAQALFVAETRLCALEEENARLRAIVNEHARHCRSAEDRLGGATLTVRQLRAEADAARAYIVELEEANAELRSHLSVKNSPDTQNSHPCTDITADKQNLSHQAREVSFTEDTRLLAAVVCDLAEVCDELQRRCLSMVSGFSCSDSSSGVYVKNDAFAGLDCSPPLELIALASHVGNHSTRREEAHPGGGKQTGKLGRHVTRDRDSEACGTVAESDVCALKPDHPWHAACTLLVRQLSRLASAVTIAAEVVSASERVHRSREHALRALDAVCAKQKETLHSVASTRHHAERLEAVICDQASRLHALQREEGELREDRRVLRRTRGVGLPRAAVETAQEPTVGDALSAQSRQFVQTSAHETDVCRQQEAAAANTHAREPHLVQRREDEEKEKEKEEKEEKEEKRGMPREAHARGRMPLRTPDVSYAPLSVVDAVYSTASATAERSPRSPQSRDARHGSSPEPMEVASSREAARRVAAASTAAHIRLIHHTPHVVEEERRGLWEPSRREPDAAMRHGMTGETSQNLVGPAAKTVADAIYSRARRWGSPGAFQPAAEDRRPMSSTSTPSSSRSASPLAAVKALPARRREEDNGVVLSANVSPSPTGGTGGRGAFDSWQERFRAVMEAHLDDV